MIIVEKDFNTMLGSTFIFDNELESVSISDKVVVNAKQHT